MKISTVAQMRTMDRAAIEQMQIPEIILMENAGLAATQVITQRYPLVGQRWLLLCGVGNNGGDGLVVARQLHSRGAAVHIIILGDPTRYGEAAAISYAAAQALNLPITHATEVEAVQSAFAACDGIVDGLLGTGITRAVTGLYADMINAINASGKPVVSLDIASGINGDTGQVMGTAIRATQTITFGLPKIGNLLYPGYEQGGDLWVSHIGFPPRLTAAGDLTIAVNSPVPLPPRTVAGHKGTFGDILVVAGAGSYYGAPYYAAVGAMKAGGGYVRLATPHSVAPVIAARAGEVVYLPQAETTNHSLARSNRDDLLQTAGEMDFVIVGPGTSLDDETQALLRELVAEVGVPLLIDGDGISAVKDHHDLIRQRMAPTVLTPHLAEFARLIGAEVKTVQQDPVAALRQATQALNAVIVMKGAHTLIGYPDGRVYVNLSGNSGMATAGSGDVLTGTIAAMQGLGLAFDEAVRMGVFVHGLAGDLAAARTGEDGMTAQDILESLPEATHIYRRQDATWLGRYTLKLVGEG